jgi:hypothetical protein
MTAASIVECCSSRFEVPEQQLYPGSWHGKTQSIPLNTPATLKAWAGGDSNITAVQTGQRLPYSNKLQVAF